MKNLILVLIFLSGWQILFAQNIENASFDSLFIGGIDRIWDWTSSDAHHIRSYQEGDTMIALEANYTFEYAQEVAWTVHSVWETPYSDAGISLQTDPGVIKENGQPFETYLVNGPKLTTGQDGYIDLTKSGSPFPYRPMILKGFYQFTDEEPGTTDYGKCIVLLKKYNSNTGGIDTIGFVKSTMDLSMTTDWEAFEIPVQYNSAEIPDSIVIAFYAGTNPDENQTLSLDELTFDFTTSIEVAEEFDQLPQIYPNPNNGLISINPSGQEITLYQLYSITGKLLKSGAYEESLDLNDFKNQLFILKLINSDNRVFSFKVLKI